MRDLKKLKECVVIKLDKSQLGMLLLGTVLVTAGTFSAGVVVGRDLGPTASAQVRTVALDSDKDAKPLMTRIAGGTRTLHAELGEDTAFPVPRNPTAAARIEAQRQIAEARRTPTVRSLGPVPVGQMPEPAATEKTLTWVNKSPKRRAAASAGAKPPSPQYTLQVTAFRSEGPARAVNRQLQDSGYPSRVRPMADEEGSPFWRVEVGNFASTLEAETFRSRFERREGYPTLLVPVR